MKLIKHIILREGKRPSNIPLDKPLPSNVISARRYIACQLMKIVGFYNSTVQNKQADAEKYSLSLAIERNEGTYTYNLKDNLKTAMFVYIESETNNEILLEWLIE